MESFTVIYDACLFYPAALRDLLVELARTGMFRARWTTRIHMEWVHALCRDRRDLDRDRLQRVAALINMAVPDCLVSGFESLEDELLDLPDVNDRHVLAAAVHCRAHEIITFNLSDFPEPILRRYGVRATHPDAFVKSLLGLDAEGVCRSIQRIRSRLLNPARSMQDAVNAGNDRQL